MNCIKKVVLATAVFAVFNSNLAFAVTYGSISGEVVDAEGVIIPDAKVKLLSPNHQVIKETQAVSGNYQFLEVPFGDYEVSVEAPGAPVHHYQVHVSSGSDSYNQVAVQSSAQEMVVEVKAKRRLIQNSASSSRTEITQEQIKQLPQGSEITLPKLLTSTTPGIVQGGFGQMFVRGNHGNIQYQIDGVQMPESPSNSFGQAISPRNIEQMEVITGGIPAEYGQRLSAVVNIQTKTGKEKPEGEFELNYGSYNTTTPHLMYGGSNESGNLHYFLSLGYQRTDRGLNTPQPISTTNQFEGGKDSVHNVSSGDSEFAKVDWQADNSNKVSFIVSNSQSRYEIPNYPSSFLSTDPFFQADFQSAWGKDDHITGPLFTYIPSDTNDTQYERNTYTQAVWKHSFSEKAFLQLAPFFKYSNIVVTNDPTKDLASLYFQPGNPGGNNSPSATANGTNPIAKSTPSSFAQNRHVNNLGLKGDYSIRAHERHLVKAGVQVQASRADGTVSLQRDLNTPATVVDASTNAYFESVYLQDDFTLFKPLVLNLGVRYDATQYIFAGTSPVDSLVQPRIGLNYLITDTTKFHLFYGKLFEPAPVENLRLTSTAHSTLQPYDIKAEKSDFYEAGIAQQFLEKQVASFTAYYKDSTNVIDDHQLLRTSIAQPFNFAKGFGYGFEFSVRGKVSEDWSEYFNYSYTIAKGYNLQGAILPDHDHDHDEDGHNEGADWQVLDHIQEHTSTAGITYAKNYLWWTGQIQYGSGLRTGEHNSVTLNPHFSLDTTVGYEFHGSEWYSKFRLSGDILNILDNVYPITVANGFTGSQYAAGRQFFVRLSKEF